MSIAPCLEARDVHVQFPVSVSRGPARVLHAVRGVNLNLYAGRTLGLVGESGCGKTTLGRTLCRLQECTTGLLKYRGKGVHELDRAERADLRRNVQLVFQNPTASLNPRMRCDRIIAEPLAAQRLAGASERRRQTREMLEQVGLAEEHAARYPHELSGGQRQRVAIARALITRPSVLICDEPTSSLDLSVQAQILNLLQDLQSRLSVSILLISHDLAVVRHISHDIAVMYLGAIVEHGPADRVCRDPQHPYTRALLQSAQDHAPLRGPASQPAAALLASGTAESKPAAQLPVVLSGDPPSPLEPPDGCALHPRCAYSAAECRQHAPALITRPCGWRVACHFPAST